MRINNMSDNCFHGRFIIPEGLPANEQKFAEKIINYKLNGITNKKYLRGSNFDVNVIKNLANNNDNKNLKLNIDISYIGTLNFDKGIDCTYSESENVSVEESVYKAARTLRNLIDSTEQYVDNNLPGQYNSKLQKFWVKTKMFMGIL